MKYRNMLGICQDVVSNVNLARKTEFRAVGRELRCGGEERNRLMTTMAAKRANAMALDAQRWEAVVRRDRGADGSFVYAVRTTGVYCRPSCAARRAKRENVEFHGTAAEAEREGFRACR